MLKIAEKERKKEDTRVLDFHPISHTILRVSETPLTLNLKIFGLEDASNKTEVTKAKKLQRIYNLMRTATPIFSGAICDNEINYLLELDMLKRVTPMGMIRVGLSPKQKFRFSSKFGVKEQLPYSHESYEYLRGLINHCMSKWTTDPLSGFKPKKE
jgi:hypothetical protein